MKQDRGSAMIEFALILPLLVMLLVGIVDFGRAYGAQLSITGAAREGARSRALGGQPSDVQAAVNASKGAASVTAVDSGTACPSNSGGSTTQFATVIVSASFTFGIPFVPLGTKTFTATASMRCGL